MITLDTFFTATVSGLNTRRLTHNGLKLLLAKSPSVTRAKALSATFLALLVRVALVNLISTMRDDARVSMVR